MYRLILIVNFLSWHFSDMLGQKPTVEFSLLRQNDIITVDSSARNTNSLKSIRVGRNAKISIGGSQRFQVEAFVNEEFNVDLDQTDVWLLNRSMLHSHFRKGPRLEIFGELSASIISSKQNISPVDKDLLAVNQLFIAYKLHSSWKVSLGRRNMRLGSGRLLDIREGPNVRLSFDIIDLHFMDDNTQIHLFYGGPSRVRDGIFDNKVFNRSETITGIYWTQFYGKKVNLDLYVLYKREAQKVWDSGQADDKRLSIGLRHFGQLRNLRYNNEFVYQLGSFGDATISAWTVSFNIERNWKLSANNSFVAGVKTEIISGDRVSVDQRLNTFDGLYPRGAYFGRVARIGPSNLFDLHPYVEFATEHFSFAFDYVAFWRFSTNDGVYGPPLILNYPSTNAEVFIGHQIGTIIGYTPNHRFAFELESNIIFPGSFLDASGLDDRLIHVVFTSEYRF